MLIDRIIINYKWYTVNEHNRTQQNLLHIYISNNLQKHEAPYNFLHIW